MKCQFISFKREVFSSSVRTHFLGGNTCGLLFVDKGRLLVECVNGDFVLSSGNLVFFFDESRLSVKDLGEVGGGYYLFEFGVSENCEKGFRSLIGESREFRIVPSLLICALLDEFDRLSAHDCERERGSLESLFQVLFERIAQQVEEHGNVVDGSYGTFVRVMEILEQKYSEINSVSELARIANVSTSCLGRVFNRYNAGKPLDLLQSLKMARASQLLLNGDMLVKEVAYEVGFRDPLHFSRVFRRHFRVPPSSYRTVAKYRPTNEGLLASRSNVVSASALSVFDGQ